MGARVGSRIIIFTRRIFFVHTFFIGLGVALAGAGSFLYADTLLRPGVLSRALLAGMTLFWLCRLLAQFFAYDSALWRGDRFRTFMHTAFVSSSLPIPDSPTPAPWLPFPARPATRLEAIVASRAQLFGQDCAVSRGQRATISAWASFSHSIRSGSLINADLDFIACVTAFPRVRK
jgi:hypothetical protein